MITTIVGALALSSIVPPPDYYDFQIIETPSYTVEYSVKWWESSDKYLYTLLNTDDSTISITNWAVGNAFDLDLGFGGDLDPGEMESIILFGNGFGYEDTFGVVFSDYDYTKAFFNTIAPATIPTPGAVALLGIASVVGGRRRRR
mgnify:FL=1|tara:strand:+ start:29 stop:463 length:435 start_codon:yes stop_codon:yes gene_type:complete